MASIQALKNGTFQARVRKKGKDSSQVFSTKKDAMAWAKKEEARFEKLEAGASDTNPNTFTVGDALAYYFNDHIVHKKSAEEYRHVITTLPNYLVRERLKSITRATGERYIHELMKKSLNPATIHRRFGIIRASVNYVLRRNIALGGIVNVFKNIELPKLPKTSHRTRIATDAELQAIKEKSNSKVLSDFLELALETACRRGELAKLKFSDVNFDNFTAKLWDTKNGDDREMPLSPRAIEILKSRQKSATTDYVFASKTTGGHILPASVSKAFRRSRLIVEKEQGTKLNLRLHDVRHTSATNYANTKKFDIFELRTITGHKDMRSLNRYIHKDAREVAENMRNKVN